MVSRPAPKTGGFVFTAVALAAAAAIPACSQELPRSQSGDLTRRMAPPPACILRLPARNGATSGERRLTDAQLWGLVFPNFDSAHETLPRDAVDCRGERPFDDPAFQGATSIRGWPFKVQEGDVVFGAGTNKLRVAWFRTHRYPDGSAGGVLALIRTVGDFAELYSLGTFRGQSKQVKLRIARMGSNLMPSVQNDGCLKHPAGSPCETTITIYRPVRGQLQAAARIPTERIAYAADTEPGISGPIEYHLVATPVFEKDKIDVIEQISVTDQEGREVHKAQVKRFFRYSVQGPFEASEQSLWQTMFVAPTKQGGGGKRKSARLDEDPSL